MSEFDPDAPLERQEDYDAYVQWCEGNFERMVGNEETARTHYNGHRAASWLWVTAQAMLHLDTSPLALGEEHRETLMKNLAEGSSRARRVERSDAGVTLRHLWVARAIWDCWSPKGRYAHHLLEAGKCAVSAIIVVESHPIIDKWEMDAPDVWALVLTGAIEIAALSETEGTWTPDDFAVVPSQATMDKMRWQKANQAARFLEGPPPSAN